MTNSNWILDKSNSNIRFKVRHLLVANIQGEFEDFDINIENNGEEFAAAEFKLDIKSKSVNTRLKQRDDHLKSEDFLCAYEFPSITFHSSEINEIKKDTYNMKGILTIKGISKEIEFAASYTKSKEYESVGDFAIETKISRSEFGLEWNEVIGDKWIIVDDEIKLYGNVRILHKSKGDRIKGLAGRSDVVGNNNYKMFSSRSKNQDGTFSWNQLKGKESHWIFGISTGDTEETHFRALKSKLYVEGLVKEYDQVTSTSQFLRILHFVLQDDSFLTRSIHDKNTFSLDTCYFVINKEEATIRFSSARLNVVLLKPNGLKLLPKANISIGFPYYNVGQIVEHTISFEPGDTLMVFNDELVQQTGGKHGRKLGMKTVGNVLNDNRQLPWKDRNIHLQKVIKQWAGEMDIEQILVAQIKL